MDTTKQRLLDILTQLQADVQEYLHTDVPPGSLTISEGICWHIDEDVTAKATEEFKLAVTLMHQWPKRSGERGFPVPSTTTSSASGAYREHRDMWHGSEYADLRRELLAWMIEELKK